MARRKKKKMARTKDWIGGCPAERAPAREEAFLWIFLGEALTFSEKAVIMTLFQVEAARFSPPRILFCAGLAFLRYAFGGWLHLPIFLLA